MKKEEAIEAGIKIDETKHNMKRRKPCEKRPVLFENGYNDQILLEDGQLDNWIHYLDDNPRHLAIKRLLPDYFTTCNDEQSRVSNA